MRDEAGLVKVSLLTIVGCQSCNATVEEAPLCSPPDETSWPSASSSTLIALWKVVCGGSMVEAVRRKEERFGN